MTALRYDVHTRALVLAAYKRGDRYEDIELTWGPTRRTVQAWARAAGLPHRKAAAPHARSPQERSEAVAMYLDDHSSTQVAEVFGVSHTAVARWVRDAGHGRRTGGPPRKVSKAEAVAAVEKWGSVSHAAHALGVDWKTVRRRLDGL